MIHLSVVPSLMQTVRKGDLEGATARCEGS